MNSCSYGISIVSGFKGFSSAIFSVEVVEAYSGPSSYDQPDKRITWVASKLLVLTYDQSLELRPECLSRPKRVSAWAVVKKDRDAFVSVSVSPDTRVVEVISVSVVFISLISQIAIKMVPKNL
jgi:hypothetical protein